MVKSNIAPETREEKYLQKLELRARILATLKDAKWLGVREAAAYAGISTSQAYRYIQLNDWPRKKRRGRVLIAKEDIDKWLADEPLAKNPTHEDDVITIDQARAILSQKSK